MSEQRAIELHQPNQLARQHFGAEEIALIKEQIAPKATDAELKLFVQICERTGLDPFARQIYAIHRWNSQAKKNDMSIQVSIDGFRLIADRSGAYAGNDDPVFSGELNEGHKPVPAQATVTVWKLVGGQRCPFTATARWSEYYPGEKSGYMWLKMPHVMLGKVAEALALRKAFPAELSGLYTRDEMAQAGQGEAYPEEMPDIYTSDNRAPAGLPDPHTIRNAWQQEAEYRVVDAATGEILTDAPPRESSPAKPPQNPPPAPPQRNGNGPAAKSVSINQLRKWCRENDLDDSAVLQLLGINNFSEHARRQNWDTEDAKSAIIEARAKRANVIKWPMFWAHLKNTEGMTEDAVHQVLGGSAAEYAKAHPELTTTDLINRVIDIRDGVMQDAVEADISS